MNDDGLAGRLAVVNELVPGDGRSLSVGCKETRLAKVNVDIDASIRPDVVCDARGLPFDSDSFDVVVLTAVLNVVPESDEHRVLEETRRVLARGGQLVLTVPNEVRLYRALDLGRHVSGARTYTNDRIRNLLEGTGFEVEEQFTSGNVFEPIEYLWYCLVTVPLSTLWPHREWSYAPGPLMERSRASYENHDETINGRTIFVRARKL